ncbi:MAG: hypothetical protein AAFV29_24750, partial [Myxococcota bacterium]
MKTSHILSIRSILISAALCLSTSNSALAVSGPFVPPDNGVLLIVGQDTTSVDNYNRAVGVTPGGVTGYINLSDLSGLTTDVDNGAGPNNMGYLFQQY